LADIAVALQCLRMGKINVITYKYVIKQNIWWSMRCNMRCDGTWSWDMLWYKHQILYNMRCDGTWDMLWYKHQILYNMRNYGTQDVIEL
jgi:hypothetical protein